MQWASVASEEPDLERALAEGIAAIGAEAGLGPPDLLLAFVSSHHAAGYEALAKALAEAFPSALLLGCSARSVIGGGREIETGPGLALTAARLPDVVLHPFHVAEDQVPAPEAAREYWFERTGISSVQRPHFVLLADPFSSDAERAVGGLDVGFPESVKVGGLASGGSRAGENALYLGGAVHRRGLVGVALTGNVTLDAIVAQGCRPVGNPMFVTRCHGNLLLEVDGHSPISVINELFTRASSAERELFRTSLFLGIEMSAAQSEYHAGDFLIRNLVGADPDTGALAVATGLHEAQVVQFHLRDAQTAAEDLERRLANYPARDHAGSGALIFSCLGRGRYLYGHPDHDSEAFRRHLGETPLAGFFCNGEIGPVQRRTFLHGYTSAFGIFRPAGASPGSGADPIR